MDDVQVLVQVFWCGSTRKEIVTVPEDAVLSKCWRTVAAMKAAALMGIPFPDVCQRAKYGLLPEDKARLEERMRSVDPQNGDQ